MKRLIIGLALLGLFGCNKDCPCPSKEQIKEEIKMEQNRFNWYKQDCENLKECKKVTDVEFDEADIPGLYQCQVFYKDKEGDITWFYAYVSPDFNEIYKAKLLCEK
jgi:hypothetical protein